MFIILFCYQYYISYNIICQGKTETNKNIANERRSTPIKKARGYFEVLGSMLSCAYRVDSALVGRDREEAFYNRFGR